MCEYAKWKLPWYIYVTKILCNQSTLYIFFIQFCSSLQQLYSILQESNSYHLKRQKHSTLKYFQVQKHWYEGGGGIITVWQIKELFWTFQCDPLALVVWEFLTFTWCQVVQGQDWATWKQKVPHHSLQIQQNRINLVHRSLNLLQNINLCRTSEKLITPSERGLSVELFSVPV